MKQRKATIQDLFIATMVREVSDRFGLPACDGDTCTPSGLPLNDSRANAVNAGRWVHTMTERFEWMAGSDATVDEAEARDIIELMTAALDDDEFAIAQLREVA